MKIMRKQDARNYMVPELRMYGKAAGGDFGYNTSPITNIENYEYGIPERKMRAPLRMQDMVHTVSETKEEIIPIVGPSQTDDAVLVAPPASGDNISKEASPTVTATQKKSNIVPLIAVGLAAFFLMKE